MIRASLSRFEVLEANYHHPEHAEAIVTMLDCYASDPMGGGAGLSERVKHNLIASLAKLPHAFSILCYKADVAVGLVNCFEVFSTFQCYPVINIHDVIVHPDYRGLGISQLLLDRVEEIACARGAGKITLEVLEKNVNAQSAYRKHGFAGYELDPLMGHALFWQKIIKK